MYSSRSLPAILIAATVIISVPRSDPRGVWQRIQYDSAFQPTDVFFTTPDEGWLAGAGTILHTSDGGAHWELQFQDSVAEPRRDLSEFRFIDGIHGWAIARNSASATLLRTIDGRVWQTIGTSMPFATDYGFLSDSVGVALASTRILRTTNSGASWAVVTECLTKLAGVPQTESCTPERLHFVSPDTGYVAAAIRDLTIAPPQAASRWILLRTTDAGLSWQQLGADYAGLPEALFFTTADTGYVRLADGFLYATRNGGSSWQQVAPSIGSRLRFADPEVGWALGPMTLTYTINSGASWDTVASGLSGAVSALSLPRRDRAYAIVGGSLFRYRVVPSADSAVDAVATIRAMPAPEGTSAADVKKLATQVLAQSNSSTPRSKGRNVDSLLADFRLLAARHRNLNLLVEGADGARYVLDNLREVQLRVRALRATSGVAARLDAFARLTVAVDSLSNVTSLAMERVPKFSIHLRRKRPGTAAVEGTSAAPKPVAAAAPSAAPSSNNSTPSSAASKGVTVASPTPSSSRQLAPTKGRTTKPKPPNESAIGRKSADTARVRTAPASAKDTTRTKPDTSRAKLDTSRGGKDTTKSPIPSFHQPKPVIRRPATQ
jgi:photosystem II stability/assembly factor-like uncharacterized protein